MTELNPDDLALMERYSALKEAWEKLVDDCVAGSTPALRLKCRHAADRIEDLKLSLGEPDKADPLCCQRYSRLHMSAFSVTGCRWYPLRERTG